MNYAIQKNDSCYVKVSYRNEMELTSNVSLASRFTYEDARSYKQNHIRNKEKRLFSIVKLEETRLDPASNDIKFFISQTSDTINNYDWIKQCNGFFDLLSKLDDYDEKLTTDLKRVQEALCDIEHRMEFPKENGAEYNCVEMSHFGYMERDYKRKRRSIKNAQKTVEVLKNSTLNDFKAGKVVGKLNGIDQQKYEPRILIELFD